jgi:hypothetical protein
MRFVIGAVTAALTSLLIASCYPGSIINPKTGPGTEWPCGLHGIECGNHTCCDDHDICGSAGTRCPEGFCCYDGDNWPAPPLGASPSDAGVTVHTGMMHRQTPRP